ncbi:restriction endonuclease subunit S [Acetivibrio clariflavus]|jgi:restriction endonuclease S subunit|uniref:restriction endonuclease subunit S n=1 Tax=Acetivibrio clariflavus TaxID=288965 RepID=UPI0031F497C5
MSKYKRYERYKDSGIEWIGEIPEHWEITKLKYICSESAVYGLNESAENYVEEGVRFIRTTDIDNKGNLDNSMGGVFLPEEKVKGYILKTGDLLVSRSGSLGTSLYFDEDKYGKCSYAGYLVKFRANSKNCPKFLFYFSKSNIFYIQIQLALVSSTISNFNGNKYANMILPLPSYYEQKAISNFLDQKTAEIDSLIADKEKLIELLQEKRQAIITEAVTKGLNPNVRMKDSGIEWIGEIPEHWNLRRIRYLANIRNVKASDSDIDKTYVGLENIESKTGKLLTNGDDEQQFVGETANIFKKGDVLFGKLRPYLAKCIIADFDGRCTSELLVLKTTSYILPKYLHFFMLSPKFIDVVNSSTYGAKMPRASWDFIGNLEIPLPSIKEQEDIVEYLTEFISRIDDLISDINTQIQKLKEYRQSLISEAVTGKIDVRDYVVSN